jgi:hypothetical protein
MIETISFTDMLHWVFGAFFAGMLAGFVITLYLVYKFEK